MKNAEYNKFHQYPYPIKFIKPYLEKKAADLCKQFVENNNRTMMALSFGKDSMIILHILSKYDIINKLKIIMFNHSGFESNDTEEMIEYVIEKYNIKNYVQTNIDNPEKYFSEDIKLFKSGKKMTEFAYNVLEKPRWGMMDRYEIDSTIIGLRKEESKGRKINYYLRGKEYYNKREKSNILQPIVTWNTLDVFSYSYTENIPINPVYYRSKKIGLDYKRTRLSTIADIEENGIESSRISKNRLLYPDEFRKMINKIPELRGLI